MSNRTNEHAFESYVEKMLEDNGWHKGSVKDWDKDKAIFPAYVLDFIKTTQGELWADFKSQHGANLETLLIATLVKELDLKGCLHVLRKGFKFYGKIVRVTQFMPANNYSPEVMEKYKQNTLTVTRQIPCHPNDHSTIDLVFAINGLPVATCELKNQWTGQNFRHAIKQYRQDRNPSAPLFRFKSRALVHFAADPDEIYMATRLSGDSTFFLPFNRGSNPGHVRCGKGNPQHPSGYRTGYFWQDVLKPDSFLDVFGSFLYVEKLKEKRTSGTVYLTLFCL